jgi:peptidoglycan-associated lipoprotein
VKCFICFPGTAEVWIRNVALAFVCAISLTITFRPAHAEPPQQVKLSQIKKHFDRGDYSEALQLCIRMLEGDPADHRALYMTGECHRMLDHLPEAEEYYARVYAGAKTRFPLSLYYLALMQKLQGKYREAQIHFELFLDERPDVTGSYFERAYFELKGVRLAVDQYGIPSDAFDFARLPPPVNSNGDERQPISLAGDSLLHFIIIDGVKRHLAGSRPSAEGWKWAGIEDGLGVVLAELNLHSGSFSSNDSCFVFSACVHGSNSCGLYSTMLRQDGWIEPVSLGEEFLNHIYHSHQPVLSQTGDTLFFASDRPGGAGGFDIWLAFRNDDGTWSAPRNPGPPINTPGDETSPFYRSDDRQLFFASDGHIGYGRTDLFFIRFVDPAAEVINLGRPFNSGGDDSDLYIGSEAGYLASNRAGPGTGWDVYSFKTLIPYTEMAHYEIPGVPDEADSQKAADYSKAEMKPEAGLPLQPVENTDPGKHDASLQPHVSTSGVIIVQRGDHQYHQVKDGESLGSIARRYGLRKKDLVDINGQRRIRLQEGQKLLISR